MNKKAVSEIVATVLIIMIVVAAVGILWATLYPMIQNNFSEGTACLDAQRSVIVLDSKYTCSNATGTWVNIQQNPVSDTTILGYKVMVIKNGNSEQINVDQFTGLTKVVTNITANAGFANATSAQVLAVIKTGKTNKTCDASPEVVLTACA